MRSTLIYFNTTGSNVPLFPVGIVEAGNAYAFGYRGVNKSMVAQIKTYVRNYFTLGGAEEYKITFAEVVSAAERFYTAVKELLNRSAWYFNMIYIAQQPLNKSRAVNASFIGATPEVGRIQPSVNKTVQGKVVNTICGNAGMGRVFLPQQLVAHHGAVHSRTGNGNGIALQNNGIIAFGAFFLRATSGQYGSCYSKNIQRFHIPVNS